MNAYENQCYPATQKCENTGTNDACVHADNVCYRSVQGPIANGADFDVYNIRQPSDWPFPPSTYTEYLNKPEIKNAIGAKSNFTQCSNSSYKKFSRTGDSKLPSLPRSQKSH